MRVLCLNQDPGIDPGRKKGAAVHLAAMRSAFATLGARVQVLDESDEEKLAAGLRAALQSGVDLVYERYALGRAAAARFAHAHGIPFVVEVNAPLAEEEARYRGGADARELIAHDRELFGQAACVIAVSTEVARYAVQRGAASERVHVFPNGVDGERFRPRGSDDPLRARLVPAGRFALGFHGRLRPWHGFELFARAGQRLLELGVPIQLVLVGEGEFEQVLAGRVPADRVTRVGWVEHAQIGPYVASFDCLPLTYSPDAPCYFSPLKLAEAMACGVVPVLPRLGDLESSASDRVDALFYPAGDLGALVQVIAELCGDPVLRARLAQGARRRAEGLSWKRIASYVLESAHDGSRS